MKKFILLYLGSLFLVVSVFADNTDAFVIKIKTDNAGNSSDTQFTLPINSDFTYNYSVDCTSD